MRQIGRRIGQGLVLVAAVLLASIGPSTPAGAAEPLVGTFAITPGSCSSGVSGSYFRMILPTGDRDGPFIENGDSTCGDRTYTPLAPGTDGGLVTGDYQPAPSTGFDGSGNSLAARIIRPVRFFGVDFSGSTDPADLQSGQPAPVPTLAHDGGRLSGNLAAFGATWNRQAFNQGAPKPDGSTPGNTATPSGTFDPATGAFSLTWASQIVGGPFASFTGLWHLEGTFAPTGAADAPSPAPSTPADAGAAPGGDPTDDAAGSTAAGSPDTDPTATTASGTDVDRSDGAGTAPGSDAFALAASVREEEGFEPPWWLVVPVAAIGIAGVVALVLLDRRPSGAAS